MIKKMKVILSGLLLASTLGAVETTLTNISFVQDENGNLNPNIFIPVYYGSDNQFYSAVGYTSGTFSETGVIDERIDSRYSTVSSSSDLTLNYFTYVLPTSYFTFSIGIVSQFSKIEESSFGYIDLDLISGDPYNALESTVNIDAQSHYIEMQAMIPLGTYINSRITGSVSPYTVLEVNQKTTFKPNVSSVGTKNSTTVQDISYSGILELQTNLDLFVNFGFTASYANEPYKYDVVKVNTTFDAFVDAKNDTVNITTKYLVKIIFDKELLGGINPSIGYGIEYLDVKDNLVGATVSADRTIFTLGIEKRF